MSQKLVHWEGRSCFCFKKTWVILLENSYLDDEDVRCKIHKKFPYKLGLRAVFLNTR